MSERDAEYVPGSDPRRAIEDGRLAKQQTRRDLAEALVGTNEPEDRDDAMLDELLDEIAERVAQRLAGDDESQPEDAPSGRRASFDGGARQPPPPRPPSHDELLGAILRERLADRGASF